MQPFKYEKRESGQLELVRANHYMAVSREGESRFFLQNGQVFSDGEGGVVKEIPKWVQTIIDGLTTENRALLGFPPTDADRARTATEIEAEIAALEAKRRALVGEPVVTAPATQASVEDAVPQKPVSLMSWQDLRDEYKTLFGKGVAPAMNRADVESAVMSRRKD